MPRNNHPETLQRDKASEHTNLASRSLGKVRAEGVEVSLRADWHGAVRTGPSCQVVVCLFIDLSRQQYQWFISPAPGPRGPDGE